jgi:hypothetical protein
MVLIARLYMVQAWGAFLHTTIVFSSGRSLLQFVDAGHETTSAHGSMSRLSVSYFSTDVIISTKGTRIARDGISSQGACTNIHAAHGHNSPLVLWIKAWILP